jgi:hypothetical protein
MLTFIDPIGNCTVDIAGLNLPNAVPLFLNIPLKDVSHGNIQIEITLDILGH